MAKREHRPAYTKARDPEARQRIIDLFKTYRDAQGKTRRDQVEAASAYRRARFAAQQRALDALEEWRALLPAATSIRRERAAFDIEVDLAMDPPRSDLEVKQRSIFHAHVAEHIADEEQEDREELARFDAAAAALREFAHQPHDIRTSSTGKPLTGQQRFIAEASEVLDPHAIAEVMYGNQAAAGVNTVCVTMYELRQRGLLPPVEMSDRFVARDGQLVTTLINPSEETD